VYIDSLTIVAFVVFVIALVMFVKTCFIMSCMSEPDNDTAIRSDVDSGEAK
jgi:hypothetical protein